MNKILFSLLVASVSFSGIQGAFATRAQKDEENSNATKRSLKGIFKTPNTTVRQYLSPTLVHTVKFDSNCIPCHSVRRPSTKVVGKENLVQEKQGRTVMKPNYIPGFRFQALLDCASQGYEISEKNNKKAKVQSAFTPWKVQKPLIMQIHKGKMTVIKRDNRGRGAYINRNGLISITPEIIVTFHG